MRKTKIEYGIDLGTTNSEISVIKNSKIKIIRDPMNQKEVTSSCVHFYKNKTVVGDKAKNKLEQENLNAFRTRTSITEKNGFIEFKRTMGTDKEYFCPIRERAYSSEELSAEVLKTLKSYVMDDEVNTVVITVPMRFRQNQIDATQRAAELAGFEYCELLEEPIAAATAFGMESKDINGYFLVFDFGGGTFDVALMRVEDRIMKVVDTSGDNHLGGKDIDNAIVNDILIPHLQKEYEIDDIINNNKNLKLLKETIKRSAEDIKINLSNNENYKFEGDEPLDENKDIELSINITLDNFEDVTKHIFQRSIDITKNLLKENNLKVTDLETVLLVGGTTYSQTIKRMIKEQITDKIDTSIDPMTAVSQGAALYAFTKDVPEYIQDKNRDKTKIQLLLEYPETTVETDVKLGIKIERDKMEGKIPKIFRAEVIRSDKGWSSGIFKITDSEVIDIYLNENETNNFIISLFDESNAPYPCEPSNFNILPGSIPDAILPYDICVEIYDEENKYKKLEIIKGLEKNTPIKDYVKGKTTILHTNQDVRPGKKEDKIRIPIYEGEPLTRPVYNEKMAEVTITGEDINEFLPKESEVEISLKIDSARRKAELTAYFPDVDETVKVDNIKILQRTRKPEELEKLIKDAKEAIDILEKENIKFDKKLQNSTNQMERELKNDKDDTDTRTKVLEVLREVQREIDKINDKHKFPKLKKEISELLDELDVINERYGDEETTKIQNKLRKQADQVFKNKDTKLAQDFIKELRAFRFAILRTRIEYWMNIIKYYDDNFDNCEWINETAAKNLINEAKEVITGSEPTSERLEKITFQIWDLLLEEEESITSDEIIKELLKE